MKPTKVVNPGPSALVFVNGKKGAKHKMATKKSRKTRAASKRRPPRSAAKRSSTKTHRRNGVSLASKRARKRGGARRSFRNPAGELATPIQIGLGAVLAQVTAGLIPFGGASPLAVAGKAAVAGYALNWLGRTFRPLNTVTAQAKAGGVAAATITLLNAYVMPTVLRWVNGVIAPPARPNGANNGVSGFMVVPRAGGALPPAQTQQVANGVQGIYAVPRG